MINYEINRFDSKKGKMNTHIRYGTSKEGWLGYEEYICNLIDKFNIKQICEIGGGANPLLNKNKLILAGIEYAILDISASELEKAPSDYQKILGDIGSPDFRFNKSFGLVFSRMLAEHIRDAEQFHLNVQSLLKPGGLAVHFFPTLYTLPYVINYLAPERLSRILLNGFGPRDEYRYAKFPAYYHWCRGPIKSQIQRFQNLGYDVVEYVGYFGHDGYYQKMGILRKIHSLKTDYLLKKPNPYLTSYAYVLLKKT
jgi:2-polyprenyl-3-methyl-5-hydroxy-6-metoxy-1,4-benzoquinol methylase